MRVVSVINYKGGVGKTTLTANLAAELAFRGRDVLAIDLDPQASLTFSFLRPEQWDRDLKENRTIKNWFDSLQNDDDLSLADLIVQPPVESSVPGKLDLIASHLGLINVDLDLATELGGATLKKTKQNYLRVHRRLKDGLEEIPEDEYDYVLIDCPPNFNVVTKTAIVASEKILIPAKPDYLSTLGIDYLQRSLMDLVRDYNEFGELVSEDVEEIGPEILGVVFTMVSLYGGQPIATMRPFMQQTRNLGLPVFESFIRDNKTLFGDAPQNGRPVVLTSHSAGTHSEVVTELEQVVSEFLQRMGDDE